MRRLSATIISALLLSLAWGGPASAYEFWGVNVGTGVHNGSTHLTFTGLSGSGIQYVVGGYKYTSVDSQWYGPFPAASPGEGYLASRKSDAQGLFFRADADAARFVIIAGSNQNGSSAPECGTGLRLFGPGDLKIDTGGQTYGIGLRIANLTWAVDPNTANPEFLIHSAGGGIADIHSRDAATLGDVELNPDWARVGHATLPAGSDMASAFFISGTGTHIGTAEVAFQATGISLYGAGVYAYEVAVPWSVLGAGPGDFNFTASWRPDCGNDILSADFSATLEMVTVPEPGSIAALLSGLVGLTSLGNQMRKGRNR